MQNWAGVVRSAGLDEAPAVLAQRNLDSWRIDPEACRAYVERYLGFDDTRSSERVLDVIEKDARLSHPA